MHGLHYADWQLFRIIRNKYIFDIVLISRQVYYADICMDLWNYSESSELNICICLNYLDRFILRYICICQSHVFLCVFHYIASIFYLSYFVNDIQGWAGEMSPVATNGHF